MAKLTLNPITSGYASATAIDTNSGLIEAAVENTLSLDGTAPNSMTADFDLNSNNLLNGATLNCTDIVVGGTSLGAQVTAAATSATNAATSETNAATSATAAAASETAAAASAASLALPTIVATNYLRGNAGGTAWETRTPAQTLTDIGGAASGANTDITSLNGPALGTVASGDMSACTGTTDATGTSSTSLATDAFVQQELQNNYRGDNPVINGEYAIDQRNEGTAVTINTASATKTADMCHAYGQAAAGVFTVQAALTSTPFAKHLTYIQAKVTTADAAPAAGAIYNMAHKIEGVNFARFMFGTSNAKDVTLIFKARSSAAGTYSAVLSNAAGNRNYPFQYTILAPNVEQTFAITIPGDTTGTWPTGKVLGATIFFDLGSGSTYQQPADLWTATTCGAASGSTQLINTLNATLDITGVDIVEGSYQREYPYLTVDKELARCQRYLLKSYNQGTVPGTVTTVGALRYFGTGFAVAAHAAGFQANFNPMRTTPTVTAYSPVTGTSGQVYDYTATADTAATIANAGDAGTYFYASTASSTTINAAVHYLASAEL